MAEATFYFDLGSPYAYLSAERLADVLPGPLAWQPISLGGLFKLTGRSSWSLGDGERRRAGIAEVQRRASLYGLPAVRWPEPWPGNYLTAMRAATYAGREGCARTFALCAFRLAFQQGLDLSDPVSVLGAAAQAGLDPRETELAIADPEIKLALREATEAAHARGVIGVPTIAAGAELFWGDDRLGEIGEKVRFFAK